MTEGPRHEATPPESGPQQPDQPVEVPTGGPAGGPGGDVAATPYDERATAAGAGEAADIEPGEDAEQAEQEDEVTALQRQLDERTRDLQRLQAEYVNYKRRVDRDRELVRQNATYQALAPITEVLDAIDRARDHGPLEDGFRVVAEQLERVVAGLGLTKFGQVGDAFDPNIHDALSHVGEDPEVQVTTCKVIAKAGYRIGDRVVRAAQVLVVDPAGSGPTGEPAGEATGAAAGGETREATDTAPGEASDGR